MRKVLIAACAMAILLLTTPKALAAGDGQIIQAFCSDGTLYAYVEIAEKHKEALNSGELTAAVTISNNAYRNEAPAAALYGTDVPVYYMLLVDISLSMPRVANSVGAFAASLTENAGPGARFLLATFGDEFTALGSFTSDGNEIQEKLSTLQYNSMQTGLYRGISDAIDYLEDMGHADGGMYNIVILSDGIEDDENGPVFDEVQKRISESSVTIHTLGFKSSDQRSEDALKNLGLYARASGGLDSIFDNQVSAEDAAAKSITAFVGRLYQLKFDISGFKTNGSRYPVVIDFYSGKTPEFKADKQAVLIPMITVPPSDAPPEASPEAPPEASPDTPQEPVSPEAPAPGDDGEEKKPFDTNLLIIGGAIIVLAAVCVLLVAKKPKKQPAATPSPYRIFMKLEVINGGYIGKSSELYLENELIVGRSRSCDIAFRDREVSDRNARIFARDGVIYIEDLSSENGTALSGMKIFSPNRLRSGDIISIGNVKFTLKF